jgi:hypothetical protein
MILSRVSSKVPETVIMKRNSRNPFRVIGPGNNLKSARPDMQIKVEIKRFITSESEALYRPRVNAEVRQNPGRMKSMMPQTRAFSKMRPGNELRKNSRYRITVIDKKIERIFIWTF